MEEVEKVLAHVEVELFGQTYRLEPTFETIALFEEVAKSSLLDPSHWHPQPKLTSSAILLWAAIGGRGSGKTVKDVMKELKIQHLAAAVALALMVHQQYVDVEKKDPAAG